MKPTARELLDLMRAYGDFRYGRDHPLAARVEKVLALHRPIPWVTKTGRPSHRGIQRCRACNHRVPCPTERLLNGEE